jgi:inhibitor of KinA sporulation pathway (predicted exonuclease)
MWIDRPYYLIIDFEATCSNDGSVPKHEMEIIEIGAVIQSSDTYEIEAEYQAFVRPVRNPQLTDFCTELTGITQYDLIPANTFPDVLADFLSWTARYPEALFCSWGEYDHSQLQRDCYFHDLAYPFDDGHLNLKAAFSRVLNLRRQTGLRDALQKLGLEFDGEHHRGLDDARNIAAIVRRICTGC